MTARIAGAAPLLAAARTTPLVLLLTVGSLLGVFAAMVKLATAAGWHPLAFLFWSLAGSGAILTALAIRSGNAPRLARRTLAYNLGSGLLSAMLPNALSFAAIPHVGAGFVALGFAFPPLLSYLLALGLKMERFRTQRAAGLALAFAGVVALVASKSRSATPASAGSPSPSPRRSSSPAAISSAASAGRVARRRCRWRRACSSPQR